MTILFTNWSVGIYVATSLLFASPISEGSKNVENTATAKTEVKEGKGCRIKRFDDLIRFRYNGPDHSQNEVQKPENWVHDEIGECDNVDQQACAIYVSESFVDNPSTSPALKNTINLATDIDPFSGTAYVTESADLDMEISNRSNP